jgi:hypothetical protein
MLPMTQTFSLGLPDPTQRATLSVYPETAAILGLSKASAYDAAKRGDIPTIRIGRRLLVPTAALRRLLLGDAVAVHSVSTSPDAA